MRRVAKVWIMVIVTVLVVAGTVVLLPRHDSFSYLRALSTREWSRDNGGGFELDFEFEAPYSRVRELIVAHGAKPDDENQSSQTARLGWFTMPDGKDAMLLCDPRRSPPTSLIIFDVKLSWFEQKLLAFRRALHLR